MPYSSRFIMEQLARGRPMPKGDPQDDLRLAISRMDAMGIDQAVHKGARVNQPDGRGRQGAHLLIDAAFPGNRLTADPRRALACARALLRHGANFEAPHPESRVSPVGALAALAATPVGQELRALLHQRVRWNSPISPGGTSAQQAWDAAQPVATHARPRVR